MSAESNTELNDIIYYRERENAPFAFKIANTEQKATIVVPTYICIANFIEYVKFEAYNTFNIDRNLNIEIVEAGQGTNELRAEDAPALQLDFDTTVREKYNGCYHTVAFYIRIVQ
jgi:hypothetical protein